MNENNRAGGVVPVHFASAIVLALEAGARLSGSLDDDDWSICRRLLIADSLPAIDAGSDPAVAHVYALRSAVLTAAAVHAAMLPGRRWEPVGEPWEDREHSRHQLERLCNLMADAVSMARALGVLDAAAMVPE